MIRKKLGFGLIVFLSGMFAIAIGVAPVLATTTYIGSGSGEPSLLGSGGILDTLYGISNLLRVDDDFDQIWFNPDGAVFAEAKHSGSTQDFGYFSGSSGSLFTSLFSVSTDGYKNGTPNAIILASQTGSLFRFGNTGFSSNVSDNVDTLDHMVTWSIVGGSSAGNHVIAWEDLSGGGDKDYQDMVVEVAGASPVPEPASMLLLGSGLIGIVGLRKKFK